MGRYTLFFKWLIMTIETYLTRLSNCKTQADRDLLIIEHLTDNIDLW